MEVINNFTTIRITKTLKNKLDSISSKNESYSDILDKIVNESLAVKTIEKSFIEGLQKRKYVDFDDIEW